VPADATGNEAACIHFLHVHFDIAKWFALAVLCLEVRGPHCDAQHSTLLTNQSMPTR
jgi:hypothetical protein